MLSVRFEETPLRLLADGISMLSLFSLFAFIVRKVRYAHRKYARRMTCLM